MSTRKTVTVVFCDVVDSTRRAEELDPEQVRGVMGRYFTVARGVLEAHGGTVEKFIGDAVMAVFGIPTLHEDDAVRALRAAVELLASVHELELRIGVNTGEVVATNDPGEATLVTGDAVNIAARLQQAAQPGQILVGEATRRLARGAAKLEPVEAVSAKGKSEPIAAFRLLSVASDHTRDAGAAPLVGRFDELSQLRGALDEVQTSRSARLVTVVGTAGVGKSRLVAELLDEVGLRVSILRGRCLPYGNGITYFPLTQVVKTAAGITDTDDRAEARAKLHALVGSGPEATEVGRVIASAIGLDATQIHEEDIFWATRRLLETLAANGPLVLVIEDIHWAEAAFLDLLEYLGEFMSDEAVLVVCLARPDLFERRPGWGRGRASTTTLTLDALPAGVVGQLFDQLKGSTAIAPALRQRILDAAEGNPLYVEEMVAMLVEDGRATADPADVHVPPTIEALLAARIDGLPGAERDVAERASVIGRVFEASAVRELVASGTSDNVGRNLLALVRKEFIRPERAELSIGDAYKFRHILIRDAAYRALAKSDRAALHEAVADWLERVAGDRIEEYGEIVGFHLEQAHAYRIELGLTDDLSAGIAHRAATWLGRAGARAGDRRDVTARIALTERAIKLTAETDRAYAALAISLAQGLQSAGDYKRAAALFERVLALADLDPGDRALARINLATSRVDLELMSVGELRCEMAATVRPLLRSGHFRRVIEIFDGLAEAYQNAGDTEGAERYHRRSLALARRWGYTELEPYFLIGLAALGSRTNMPVADAIALCEQGMAMPAFRRASASYAYENLGYLEAQRGRFDEARAYIAEAEAAAREAGRIGLLPQVAIGRGLIERFAGRFDRSIEAFKFAYDEHARLTEGLDAPRPFQAARLAQAYLDSGRLAEARVMLEEASGSTEASDLWTVTIIGGTEARLLAAEGRAEDGLKLARHVVERARSEDLDRFVILFANALEDLAACAAAAGDTATAEAARSEALAMYDAKGATAPADRLRSLELSA